MSIEALSQRSLIGSDRTVILISSLCSLVISYFLFLHTPTFRGSSNAPVGTLTTQGGAVKRRHAGSLRWGVISREDTVFLRDTVFVPKDVRSVVTFNNKQKIELESNSMIQFDEVNADRVEITLMEGKASATEGEVTVKKEEKPKVVAPRIFKATKLLFYLSELRSLEMEYQDYSTRVHGHLYKSLPLDRARDDWKPANLTLGSLFHYELNLIRPAKNERFNLRMNNWMEFAWTPIPLDKVAYILEVSRMPEFKRFLSYPSSKSALSMQFLDDSDYYWRVRAKREREVLISSVSRFAMSEKGGTSVSSFRRLPATQIVIYFVEITDRNSKSVLIQTTNIEERCPQENLKAGAYYCKVRKAKGEPPIKEYAFEVGTHGP